MTCHYVESVTEFLSVFSKATRRHHPLAMLGSVETIPDEQLKDLCEAVAHG